MMQKTAVAMTAIAVLGLACEASAKGPRPAPVAVAVLPVPGQDCSAFYDDYKQRGWTWGSGPGSPLGFGTFEGALPRYPYNEFPNWYGTCVTWGHYSATGTARW
jgi:hypothetical protein